MLPKVSWQLVDNETSRIADAEIANLEHLRVGQLAEKLVRELMHDNARERYRANHNPRDNDHRFLG